MAFKTEQEVQPENIEMIGRPVQESRCVKTRPWPSSDKQSHNHPGAADTLGTNSKPVFAHGEGRAVCEMTEDAEGVEEGKMEKKAEEKVAEAKLGVLPGMPESCLSQEAEPQSPTMDEHKPRPDGSSAEGHIKVTDRIAGQKKVFRKRQKAKPKMQTAEAAGTEGGPKNFRAPFRLQDFMCSKISKHYTVLLLLVLLAFPVNSNETSKQRTELPSSVTPSAASLGMCAVCLEPRCATTVYGIWLKEEDKSIWLKGDEEIPECFNDNLKPDKPCQGPNGSLVLRTANELEFEWKNLTSGDGKLITSVNMSCDKLNLPSKPSPAPIRNTPTPEAPNDPVADNKGSTIGGGIGGGIGSGIIILIAVLIWKRNIIIFRLRNCRRGQDRGRRQENNGVPPDEIIVQMQPLKEEVANGNVNGVHREDGSVGTAG